MTVKPVSARRQKIASDYGLDNVDQIAIACREAGVPFAVACALMEQETMGRNEYGHDEGGALSGFPLEVNADNYAVFRWEVFTQKKTSNGVGPAQITWPGFFTDMERKGLKPYVPHDNILYGLQIFKYNRDKYGSWYLAALKYNKRPTYPSEVVAKITAWKKRFAK